MEPAGASRTPDRRWEPGKLLVLLLLLVLVFLSLDSILFDSRYFHRLFFKALLLNLPRENLCDRAFISSAISLGSLLAAGLFSWRCHTHETLWQGERLLASIFASIQEGLIIKDEEFNIIRVNPVVEQWFAHGMPLVGRECYQALKGRQEPCDVCPGREALETGQAAHGVVPKPGPGGEEVGWLDLYAFPLVDPVTGKRSGVIEFLRDITEQKLAEEALRESEERYRTLVENINLGITLIDSDYRIIMTNAAQGRFFQKPASDFIHKECFREFEKREGVCRHCPGTQAMATGLPAEAETEEVRDDGSRLAVHIYAFPTFGADGQVTGFIEVVEDITARRQAEEALRESEARFKMLVEHIPQRIFLKDRHSVYITCNYNYARDLGIEVDAIVGKTDYDFYPRELAEKYRADDQRVMASDTIETFEEKYVSLGRDYWVRTIKVPVRGEHGNIVGVFGIFEDITERKQAEAALRESEQRYRLMMNNIPAVVFKGYMDWTLDLTDDKIQELTGYTKEDFNSRRLRWIDVILPEDLKGAQQVFRQALKTTRQYMREYRIRHKDARLLWIQARGQIICDAQGRVEYISGVFFDITEHKMAEEALRQSQASLAEAQRIAHIGNWEWHIPTDELHWSDEIYRIFGLTPQQFASTYEAFLEAVHPEDRHRVQAAMNNALYQGQPYEIGHRVVRPDAQERFVFEQGEVTFDAAGKPLRMLGTVQDITEIKLAQNALEESERRYRLLAENVSDVIWTMDLDLRLTYVSPSVALFSGFTPEEAMALTMEELLTPPSLEVARSTLVEELALARQGPEAPARSATLELEHHSKDGGTVWAEVKATFLRDAQGELTGVLGVTRDITSRRYLEEQLRQAQKMEVVGRLAGGVAHDFNNLLTAILGYCELLLAAMDEGTPEGKDVTEIKLAAERAALLTRQLLAFSRRQVLRPKRLDLNAVIENLGKMLERVIGEDIELALLPGPRLGQVMADPVQIEQVILNLAVNARDAMPQGGRLTIKTANVNLDENYARLHAEVEPGPYVLLAVSDTGCGMDVSIRSNIFEPFFTTKEAGIGTGLGLSMVYGIVKQSGGHIWVYSEPGQGTVFKIYLPRLQAARETAASGPAAEIIPQGRETILLVEDEEVVRQVTHRILQRQGYTVLDAKDGQDALEILEQHPGPVHLMVTDLVMPGMNGRELALKMTAAHPEMKVLYMSGYAENGIVNQGVLEEGIVYIQKPFEARVLAYRVRELLDASLPRH